MVIIYIGSNNSWRISGRVTFGTTQRSELPAPPLETPSALFREDSMYEGLIDKSQAARVEEIWDKQRLREGFQEWPCQNELITEVLSQWIIRQAWWKPCWTSHRTANSIAKHWPS